MSAKLMTVIVTDMECRCKGVEGDPCRRITQYWTPNGTLLVEKDPCANEGQEETLLFVKGYDFNSEHEKLLLQRGRLVDLIVWLTNCEELTPEHRKEAMIRLMREDGKGGGQ